MSEVHPVAILSYYSTLFNVALCAATKSSESLNRHAAVDEDVNGVVGLLQPKSLVPRSARTGQCSPGSEMLTLRQFLQEANQESESSVGKLSLAKVSIKDAAF